MATRLTCIQSGARQKRGRHIGDMRLTEEGHTNGQTGAEAVTGEGAVFPTRVWPVRGLIVRAGLNSLGLGRSGPMLHENWTSMDWSRLPREIQAIQASLRTQKGLFISVSVEELTKEAVISSRRGLAKQLLLYTTFTPPIRAFNALIYLLNDQFILHILSTVGVQKSSDTCFSPVPYTFVWDFACE